MSVRAFNVLKANGVNFVEEIEPYLAASDDPLTPVNPNLRRVRIEIEERVRRWRDDSGDAGVAARR